MRTRFASVLAIFVFVGCDAPTDSRAVPRTACESDCETKNAGYSEEPSILVDARYICVPDVSGDESNAEYEYTTDAFHVDKVIRGDFPLAEIRICRTGQIGPEYPRGLEEGKKYRLEIKPTERLKKELSRYGDNTIDWLSVIPDEICCGQAD